MSQIFFFIHWEFPLRWKSTHIHQKLAYRIPYTYIEIAPNLSEYAMCVRYWFYGTQHSQFFYGVDSERLVYENGACPFYCIFSIWNCVWNSNISEVAIKFRKSKWTEIWGNLIPSCKTVQILENSTVDWTDIRVKVG